MVKRAVLIERPRLNTNEAQFVTSGSYLLDLVLGGGWCVGRVANLVGDRSSGKTLLAIEACVNFARIGRPDHVRYAEAESAMDETYAANLGMPDGISRSKDGEIETVEQFSTDFLKFIDKLNGKDPALYVVDSLDALSNTAEMNRKVGEATYGMERPKLLSEFFRKHVRDISEANCTLLVISQVRDNIGVTFGERHKRAGGKALDFYASQILWLSEIGKIARTFQNAKRAVGVNIKARTKKLKVGMPFRECEMPLMFNYGIDDEIAMLDWLHERKALTRVAWKGDIVKALTKARKEQDRETIEDINAVLREAVGECWMEIEEALRPPLKKYA